MMFYECFFLLCVVGFSAAGEMNPDKKLLAVGLKYAADCASTNGIKFDTCAEMFQDGANLGDAKYEECKCWIPCVAKKMKTMKEDGSWDLDAVKNIVDNLQTPEWKSEAQKVYPLCNHEAGTNCEGGFNAFVCVMKNSEKAKTYIQKVIKAMSGQ